MATTELAAWLRERQRLPDTGDPAYRAWAKRQCELLNAAARDLSPEAREDLAFWEALSAEVWADAPDYDWGPEGTASLALCSCRGDSPPAQRPVSRVASGTVDGVRSRLANRLECQRT
jgi:hypothetical protein